MRLRFVVALFVTFTACKRSGPAKQEPLVLEDRPLTLEWHDMKTTITARVPKGWVVSGSSTFEPRTDFPDPATPSISYAFGNRACDGECDDGDIEKNMAEMWAGHLDGVRKPFLTGDPALDDVRLDVEVVEDAPLPDGRAMLLRVRRPAGFDRYPHVERLDARCAQHRKGEPFYVMANVYVPFADEKTLWPLLVEACKTPFAR